MPWIFFTGCTSHVASPSMEMTPPAYVQQEASTKARKKCHTHEGSLFGRGQNPIFTDNKARAMNDILTVVIDESAIQSSNGNKKITDLSQNNMGGGVFGGGVLKTFNGLTDVSFKTNSNSTFSGAGSASRNEKFHTTISARIVKILPNGNYFIAGRREIMINGSKQLIQITGVARSSDIDQYNTINSKYIADAKIKYINQDDIQEATKRPWGTTIIDSIWPF